jgi:hypothetical protein
MPLLSGLIRFPRRSAWQGLFDFHFNLQSVESERRAKSVKLSEYMDQKAFRSVSALVFGSLIIPFPSSPKDEGKGISSGVENR